MNQIEQSKTQRLNELHGKILDGIRTTVELAIEAGGILAEVKETIPHGQFQQWVEDNTAFDVRTAQRYMKAHRNRDRLKHDTVSSLKQLTEDNTKPASERKPSDQSAALAGLLGENPKIRVTESGIEFLEPLTFAEWEDLLTRASYLNPGSSAASWIVGDLVNHGNQMQELAYAMQWLPPRGKAAYIQGAKDSHRKEITHFVVANCKHDGYVIREWSEMDDDPTDPNMTIYYDTRGVRADRAFEGFDMSDAELQVLDDGAELLQVASVEKTDLT